MTRHFVSGFQRGTWLWKRTGLVFATGTKEDWIRREGGGGSIRQRWKYEGVALAAELSVDPFRDSSHRKMGGRGAAAASCSATMASSTRMLPVALFWSSTECRARVRRWGYTGNVSSSYSCRVADPYPFINHRRSESRSSTNMPRDRKEYGQGQSIRVRRKRFRSPHAA